MAAFAKQSISRRTEASPAETLRALACALPEDATFDSYGAGALIEDLERDVAALLGKDAAVFCTSGKAAQLSALRVHADRRGRNVVAAHPRSHIVEDEDQWSRPGQRGEEFGQREQQPLLLGSPIGLPSASH